MNELERVLVGDSAAAPPAHILEGLSDELVRRPVQDLPHTIFAELWHIAFWQQMTLDWVQGIETPFPEHAALGFPRQADVEGESWGKLCRRFLHGNHAAAAIARDPGKLDRQVRCPSQPGHAVRVMSVREQLESLGAHNAYHFGRIVVLRQLSHAWPPAAGGFTW